MTIDKDLILRIEHLARLELSELERQHIQTDLNNILDMVSKLDELDTEGVAPLVYITERNNAFREDVVANEVAHTDALKNAPQHDEHFFIVPKVVDVK